MEESFWIAEIGQWGLFTPTGDDKLYTGITGKKPVRWLCSASNVDGEGETPQEAKDDLYRKLGIAKQ